MPYAESQPVDRQRVGARRRLEVDVEASVQLGRGDAADAPMAGPVGFEPRLVVTRRRTAAHVHGAGSPRIVDNDLIAHGPCLAVLDGCRGADEPVAANHASAGRPPRSRPGHPRLTHTAVGGSEPNAAPTRSVDQAPSAIGHRFRAAKAPFTQRRRPQDRRQRSAFPATTLDYAPLAARKTPAASQDSERCGARYP